VNITKMLEELAKSSFGPTVSRTNAFDTVLSLISRLEWLRANPETLNFSF
jgi:hypothetical protein